jgi:hypothetical protein
MEKYHADLRRGDFGRNPTGLPEGHRAVVLRKCINYGIIEFLYGGWLGVFAPEYRPNFWP